MEKITEKKYNFEIIFLLSQGTNAGGGSGGALWVECTEFVGTGYLYSRGGQGKGYGGGGAGGRVSVYYTSGNFKSSHIVTNGNYLCVFCKDACWDPQPHPLTFFQIWRF